MFQKMDVGVNRVLVDIKGKVPLVKKHERMESILFAVLLVLSALALMTPEAVHAITAPVVGDDGYSLYASLIAIKVSGYGKVIFALALIGEIITLKQHPLALVFASMLTLAIYNFDLLAYNKFTGLLVL